MTVHVDIGGVLMAIIFAAGIWYFGSELYYKRYRGPESRNLAIMWFIFFTIGTVLCLLASIRTVA